MGRGGWREGAGRHSDAEIRAVRQMIDRAVGSADWMVIFKRLAADAKDPEQKGNNKAAEMLLAYKFGMPTPLIPSLVVTPLVPIKHIEVVDGERPHRASRRPAQAKPSQISKKSMAK